MVMAAAIEDGITPEHVEDVKDSPTNVVYDDVDHEPKLHRRTWMALIAMFTLNFVTGIAVFSPPAVVSRSNQYHVVFD